MKRNVTSKNLLRTIRRSFGRYLAIALIIALGASMFVGLLSTKSDMVATGQKFLDQQNMFDLRLICTYGWTQKEVDAVTKMAGVSGAEGQFSMDAVMYYGEAEEGSVYQLHSIPEHINKVYLLGGRMPQSPDECLLDGFHVGDEVLGTQITLGAENSQESKDNLACQSFTVVGYVSTPLYMDMSRGSTSLGNGSVAGYLYLSPEAFDMDVFTEIAVTIEGEYAIYSDEFTASLEAMAEQLEPHVTVLAQERFAGLVADAEQEYAEGRKEYEDQYAQFQDSRETALKELADALAKLEENQNLLNENRISLEKGYVQLNQAQAQLDENLAALLSSKQELSAAKVEAYEQLAAAYSELMANFTQVTDGLAQVNSGIQQIENGLSQIDSATVALENGLSEIQKGLSQLELAIGLKRGQIILLQGSLDAAENAFIPNQTLIDSLKEQLATAQMELETLLQQQTDALAMQAECEAQLETIQQQRVELLAQQESLLQTKVELEAALEQLQAGLIQLQGNQAQADMQFATAQAQIEEAQLQIDAAQAELDASRAELDAGMQALEEAQNALDAGMEQYEQGKQSVESQLAEAENQLLDAALQLEDARKAIDSMEDVQVFILDRNSNAGYIALDNNSDIVSGVSRVFPAFFLLVAALVCITTMTRMVEEERTQIGTMKALGYGNWRIISKYIFYAGSAAVVGCGLGTILGSVVFPNILWQAYKIILNITPGIVLQIDWMLCGLVVLAYTTVMLLVTWYCCRRALKEVPAELIRPKAPTSGKKIWLEYLPFWKRFSFLNKVMLRNVFRYRQRMLMMLVGVGGCTALLLTGFGLRDSLVNIANDQFETVTVYEMAVYFNSSQNEEEQSAFREAMRSKADQLMFVYQTSVEIEFDGNCRELYMVVADEKVKDFIHFRENGEELTMPGLNEAFLSAGMADKLGLSRGDEILLRDADRNTLTVTIAGIYDNMVDNYAIITPETYAAQLGAAPGQQMAFINTRSNADIHETAALAGEQDQVMNVMVCQDVKDQVTSMLEALDMVVVVIVICAGALAVIVLYNLTNINITERIREIATIKVLGFHSMESAMYVFKENLLLSGMGVAVGLVMGKFLLDFVISQIKVDFVFFSPTITGYSCILAAILTIFSALIVDCILYFKLEKINMAEALKFVE